MYLVVVAGGGGVGFGRGAVVAWVVVGVVVVIVVVVSADREATDFNRKSRMSSGYTLAAPTIPNISRRAWSTSDLNSTASMRVGVVVVGVVVVLETRYWMRPRSVDTRKYTRNPL